MSVRLSVCLSVRLYFHGQLWLSCLRVQHDAVRRRVARVLLQTDVPVLDRARRRVHRRRSAAARHQLGQR